MFGFIGDLIGGNAQKKAAKANNKLLSGFETKGNQYIDTGSAEAKDYLGQAGDIYGDMADRGLAGLDFLPEALGLRGPEGNARTMERFQTGPGYDWATTQALDAVARTANARGQLNSGNTNDATVRTAFGLADNEFDGWLDRITGLDTANRGMYMAGASGEAGSLGSLADLAGQTTDRRLGLGAEILSGRMGANNQKAAGTSQIGSGFGKALGGIAGLALGGYQ